MNRIERMSRWGAGLAVGALLLATLATLVRAGGQDTTMSGNPAPTGEQIRLLFTRVVENQHRNDRAIEEFERVEHVVSHKSSDTSDGFTERTERILPSGTGTMKLLTVENGSHVSPEAYRHQLQIAVAALDRKSVV
jgi:poly(3-hydroxybutyrate) depolymerase